MDDLSILPRADILLLKRHMSRDFITYREGEVVEQVLLGRENKEIADRLMISYPTVKVNLDRVFRKIGVQSKLQLVLRYARGI